MKKITAKFAAVVLAVCVASTWVVVAQQQRRAAAPSLEERVKALEAKVGTVQDVQDIYNLQNAYGYYLDRGLFDDVSDLFSDDAVVEINARGVYKGKNVRNLFKGAMGGGQNGYAFGRINTHMQLQGVVNVDPGGQTAKGRWRTFAMIGNAGRDGRPGMAMWSQGPYEIGYKKVNGKWMFQTMRWDPEINSNFHTGWDAPLTPAQLALAPGAAPAAPAQGRGAAPQGSAPTAGRNGPDEPATRRIKPFPEVDILPFHYNNPVTGKPAVIPPPR